MDQMATPLSRLCEHFRKMPGIGRKSAQKLAFYILSLSDEEVKDFVDAITDAKQKLMRCKICQNISDTPVCPICSSEKRDKSLIMVVEDAKDVLVMEKMREYNGTYHVLDGVLSPIDGIGPEDLKIKELLQRISNTDIKEIILAISPTVSGETTSLFLSRLLKPFNIKTTRIAYGIPVGADLEYTDETTLLRAYEGRQEIL